MNDPTGLKLRVAIVGGGIGGLALAAALGRMDREKLVEIDVYEAAPELTQVGAGLTIWPRTWDIFQKIGMEDTLAGYLGRHPDDKPSVVFQIRKSDHQEGVALSDYTIKGGTLRFHRADLQQALLKHISPACRFHLSHRLASYTESKSSVLLQFTNGSSASCDLLIGADGVKSVVRRKFLEASPKDHEVSTDPVWSGTVAYRGLIPADVLKQRNPDHRAISTPMFYCGKNKHVVVYPISQEHTINVVAFCSDPSKEGATFDGPAVVETTQEELMSMFTGWEAEVQDLLQCIDKPSRWAIQALRPLDKYAAMRVALLGDSAHAMTPHQGAGAGQAIEDAYILAAIVSSAARNIKLRTVPRMTEIYSNIRQPIGNHVLNASRNQGLMCELNAPGFESILEGDSAVPVGKLDNMAAAIAREWDWNWLSTVEEDRKRALAML